MTGTRIRRSWLALLALLALLAVSAVVAGFARVAGAQQPPPGPRAPVASLTGVVYDSIAGAPLPGADVQLVDARDVAGFGMAAVTDSLGRFTLSAIPDGRYMLGFLHPLLDSLGVDPPVREVVIDGAPLTRVDLGIPSPARLRRVICGPGADSMAVVVGTVRDARSGAPVARARVVGEWLEVSFRRGGIGQRIPRLVATTGENGWFALCNVPLGGTMTLLATVGADSTSEIELQVPPQGFLRRGLFLDIRSGTDRVVGRTVDSPGSPDSTAGVQLRGRVLTVEGARAVAGAQVRVVGGPETVTDETGGWRLQRVPPGTHMLEVRALGFYPERRPVDAVTGAAPVQVSLGTLKAVLDTVRVIASRRGDMQLEAFSERRRSGMGRFLGPEDIARYHPIVTSELFRTLPGFRGDSLRMRGLFTDECTPAIYIDGQYMNIGAEELNSLVAPEEIAGVEVYSAGFVPAQFDPGLSGCGSIVVWRTPIGARGQRVPATPDRP